ncbi:unnamed protein product [Phaedon cochleariae]|uniref:Adenosine deaminase domain-containing protein n=1 Tax=Phaedon cochleariae TaxID=80249 RepID=A0A9P0DKX2_PHACE|nr:unnamed protein product [Phaedon cochleariae]
MNVMEESGLLVEKLEETLKHIKKLSMRTYLKFLPKIELHAHLNGSLNDKILKELGCEEDSIMQYKKLTQSIDKSDNTLQECFDVFKIAQNATKTQESVYLATKSVIEDFVRDGVVYLELRTTPRSEINMSKEEYIESVIRGIESLSGSKEKIFVKLILSIDRRHDKKTSEESLKIILKMREKYPNIIKGIDFSGNPNAGEFDAALFEEARKNGLKTSIHCAEIQNDDETKRILEFGPDRIGHATYLHPLYGGSQENWDLYCKKKIPVGNEPIQSLMFLCSL